MAFRLRRSTRLPKEQPRAAVGIRITGRKGDTIYIASRHLETGCIPARMEEAIPPDPDHARLSPETIAMGTSAGVNVWRSKAQVECSPSHDRLVKPRRS